MDADENDQKKQKSPNVRPIKRERTRSDKQHCVTLEKHVAGNPKSDEWGLRKARQLYNVCFSTFVQSWNVVWAMKKSPSSVDG